MDTSLIITSATGFMAVLGGLLAVLLIVANKRFYVFEDPRIDEVEDLLPRANCGACGSPGCRAFAEGLVAGTFQPGQCTANTSDKNKDIASMLGVAMSVAEKQLPRVACAGGSHVAWQRAHYEGMEGCRAADLVAGGGKGCNWSCLGQGDCVVSCQFDAIYLDRNGLPHVDAEKCTACGDCIDACPRALLSMQPISHKLWVACNNKEFGDKAESDCGVACTACGRCEMDAAEGLIAISNNLATVNYTLNNKAEKAAIERCPTGAIVWLEKDDIIRKGKKAKKVIRKDALPVA
ncbi:(Fe-S)-binding protein [Endozoicomonas lisbonensis]|uniref:(Fe-S)-binding protein n=1 Tax=Endozoicomonas lisbonensis TaxID=3120522 RepID=UPI0033960700